MASTSRKLDLDLAATAAEEKLYREPYCFDFFQAVLLLERIVSGRSPVGNFAPPASEVVHFSANASLAFPASAIQALEWSENGPCHMTVNFMGLTGPEGTLPNPYTSLIIERLRASDTSLADFFDIFNHRIISLFYRAWKKYRVDPAGAQSERNDFSLRLLSLIGLGTDGLQERESIPDEALIYYAGLLAQKPRSAQALQQILNDYFNVPVAIEQFAGSWRRLDPQTQCCMGEDRNGSTDLGLGVVLGDAVWDQQSTVRVILGPLGFERYLDFLPGGSEWKPLRAWLRFFSNEELDFEIQPILKREDVPACQLGLPDHSAPRLGWTSWMRSGPFEREAADTVLTLE